VAVEARDALVPGGAIGALVAPADVPLELALGASWSAAALATGDADISVARTPPSAAVDIQAPTVDARGARASGRFASPLVLHAGVRWIGARHAVEGGATAWSYRDGGDDWTITGARVVDETGASAPIERMSTRIGRRSHGALRASADVELLPGFAWISVGYGWRGAAQSRHATTLGGVDRGGHTLALGAELTAGTIPNLISDDCTESKLLGVRIAVLEAALVRLVNGIPGAYELFYFDRHVEIVNENLPQRCSRAGVHRIQPRIE
jgi:hypothetical protein